MTIPFSSLLKSLFTSTGLPAYQKFKGTGNSPALQKSKGHLTFSLWLLSASSVMSQSHDLPNFKQSIGTALSNTNGNWVRVDPEQPNNIDLIESRIFKTPAKGSGISAVEFKLVGADGGTAHYQSGAYNQFANGGRGGELTFTLKLVTSNPEWHFGNQNTFDRPFLVTFGKKGESTQFDQGFYCSAGGGGSSGMSWLEPNNNNRNLRYRWDLGSTEVHQLIAGAGGGSGGFATAFQAIHGKSATRDASSSGNTFDFEREPLTFLGELMTDAFNQPAVTLVSGGSGLDNFSQFPIACCTRTDGYGNQRYQYTGADCPASADADRRAKI